MESGQNKYMINSGFTQYPPASELYQAFVFVTPQLEHWRSCLNKILYTVIYSY
uniref:Uncharacterized protein n=1 Tax=Meloidogyne enterolobii TaxID=390850 RepID=A0A6V7WN26_MELEN|nr:unnamed protein product [Meloidogyne enterolobii]